MLLGVNYYLFIAGISQAYLVFKRKTSLIFILVISGLIVSITEATVSYIWLYVENDYEVLLGSITCVAWHFMLQIPCWLYCLRIQSLMGYDYNVIRYVRLAPFILALSQIPSAISFIIAMVNYDLWGYFVICSAFTTCVACIVEILLNVVLLRRVSTMFQYRKQVKKQMAMALTGSMVLLILIDICLLAVKLSLSKIQALSLPSPVAQLDNALRPFSYMLRIKIAIRFFDDLIDKVNNRPKTTDSYARWFNSAASE